jgi:hypothetical protein
MSKYLLSKLHVLLPAALLLLLAACSPKYNWREIHGKDGSFTVLLPDKPVSMTRKINLDNQQVEMTMTAAEVDGVSFAVGYAQLADAKSAAAALNMMKEAMLHNINGVIRTPSTAASSANQPAGAADIEAIGTGNDGRPVLLRAHFEAKGNRVYQAVALGNEQAMPHEEIDTFLSSFKPN